MWDDVIIGSGNKGTTSSTVFNLDLRHSISENRVSYWISDGYFDCGMTIFKDTEEGKHLDALIKARQEGKLDREPFDDWLESLTFKYLPYNRLKELIRRAMDRSFKAGSEQRAAEIRTALGLHS